eukprot:CAMPEP_0117482772 /NCGR_PEP_ID=MMETSP0784-20121206/13591_1 /TAXON_ID=39447 /ORGANISM="" /LENGTH=680 /DNA_ID=CAMNT_0005277277 /DNA_START=6 /DNA_END=2048 /DNA_ORIENTATION=-
MRAECSDGVPSLVVFARFEGVARPGEAREARSFDQLVAGEGPAAPFRVDFGHRCLRTFKLRKEGVEDAPTLFHLVVPDEVVALPLDHVVDELLVGLGQPCNVEAPLQVQVEDRLSHIVGLGAQPGRLGEDLVIDGLVRLHSHDELVLWLWPEDAVGGLPLELEADNRGSLLQALAGLHDEGNSRPPFVVEVEHHCCEGGAPGRVALLLVYSLYVLVVLVALVLANNTILQLNWPDLLQDLHLLVAHILRLEARGRLHRDQSQKLQQVVLHDVADDAGVIEVARPPGAVDVFFKSDPHVRNVVRMEEPAQLAVREAEAQDVESHRLRQVVVYAEDLLLLEVPADAGRQLLRRREVSPEGLLYDEAVEARRGCALLTHRLDRLVEEERGQCKVEHPVVVRVAPAERLDPLLQGLHCFHLLVIYRAELQLLPEGSQICAMGTLLAQVRRQPLFPKVVCALNVLRIVWVVDADDVDVRRQFVGQKQLEERRERLLLGQITGRPQHHEGKVVFLVLCQLNDADGVVHREVLQRRRVVWLREIRTARRNRIRRARCRSRKRRRAPVSAHGVLCWCVSEGRRHVGRHAPRKPGSFPPFDHPLQFRPRLFVARSEKEDNVLRQAKRAKIHADAPGYFEGGRLRAQGADALLHDLLSAVRPAGVPLREDAGDAQVLAEAQRHKVGPTVP